MRVGEKDKIHFPGLNSLRFFAAFLVLVGHVELIKGYMEIKNEFVFFERLNLGGIGVYFFFVLSGFLITFLLCAEKERFNTIGIKKFYIRRILRIWPLYFFIVILGFFILPQFEFFKLLPGSFSQNFMSNLTLYLLIVPNIAFSFFAPVPHIGQLWSIGVEEQFYIFWPLVVKFSRNVLNVIMILLIFYVGLKGVLVLIPQFVQTGPIFLGVKKFFAMAKFECMIIGGIGAYIFFIKKVSILNFVYNKATQVSALVSFPFFSYAVGVDNFFQDIIHIPLSVVFLIIILNVATNPNSILKIDSKVLNYLGQISYGIYMYHMIIIFVCIKVAKQFLNTDPVIANCLVYLLSVLLTCGVAHLSYKYFEAYFISLKAKFTAVVSG
jgi:peptidoglycan/LPS O-acetylase OafA/YrhL